MINLKIRKLPPIAVNKKISTQLFLEQQYRTGYSLCSIKLLNYNYF
jgi:hypothetical protein